MSSNSAPKAAPAQEKQLSDLEKSLQAAGIDVQEKMNSAKKNAKETLGYTKEESKAELARTKKDYDIENNPFYRVFYDLDEARSAEEKKQKIAELMTYDENLEIDENEKRQEQYEQFKEYMMAWRKDMALDIIELTNVETYAELCRMYDQINSGLLDYREKLKPLTDIIDAIQTLHDAGEDMHVNIYEAIKSEDVAQAEYERTLKAKLDELKAKKEKIEKLGVEKTEQENNRNLFRKVKRKAQARLAMIEEHELPKLTEETEALEAEVREMAQNPPEEKYAEFKDAKQKIKDLVGTDPEMHKQRVEGLRDAARNFVLTIDERGNKVLDNYKIGREHLGLLEQGNRNLGDIYAVLGDATDIAKEKNLEIKAKYEAPVDAQGNPVEEEFTEGLLRDRKLEGVNSFVQDAEQSEIDTKKVRGQLTAQKLTLSNARSLNKDQIRRAQDLIGSTNAQIAEGLVTAVNAVTNAATDAASQVAQDTSHVMQKINDSTIENEMERTTQNVADQTARLKEANARLQWIQQLTSEAASERQKAEQDKVEEIKASEILRKGLDKVVTDFIATPANVQAGSTKQSFNTESAANGTAATKAEANLRKSAMRKPIGLSTAKKTKPGV